MRSVWVKLYIGGSGDKNPTVFKLKPIPDDINDLKKKIKEEERLVLPASHLDVYPKGTKAIRRTLSSAPPTDTTEDDPLIVVSREGILDGGSYTLGPPQQNSERRIIHFEQIVRATRREIYELKVKDSRAVRYTDYYKAKQNEGRILNWVPEMQGDFLPAALHSPNRESELHVVKTFWEQALRHRLVQRFSNGYEVCYLGSKKPDITFYPSEISRPAPHL